MKAVILLVVVTLTLFGCATTSPTCDLPKVEGEDVATVVIYRPYSLYGALYSTPFSIDHCRIENLENDAFIVHRLPAGIHRIAAERYALAIGGDGEVSGHFESGKVYYLYYSMYAGGAYYIPDVGIGFITSTHFYITSKEDALEIMPELTGAIKI